MLFQMYVLVLFFVLYNFFQSQAEQIY